MKIAYVQIYLSRNTIVQYNETDLQFCLKDDAARRDFLLSLNIRW